ncbi:hypothetical protein HNR19_000379 [Nocardioides thalensis]|uniref:histidine kinase n=1 Tax=Nocardioides thalensis TaxID=1914755 RepID=A0A853BXJ0_9ACTN|nr:PAS domain S-box protein [Nocardioides thalensis]NYI99680.1 hypothetical protein [Nocardioides thalensis]
MGTDGERLPTIVIVDDAVEVRTLVRTRLRLSRRLAVVGEGSSGQEAIDLARHLRPDLMLLDVSMPGMDGLEALPEVREQSPDTRVVMYSGFDEQGLAERTLELGATAFFEKASSLEGLVDDLLGLLDGEAAVRRTPSASRPTAAAVEPVLREHLERFREVFEDAAIGMATMTLSGRLVRANASLGQLTGRNVGDLIATSYAELAGPDGHLFDDALQSIVRGDRDVVQFEHRVVGGAPGSRRRLVSTLSSVRDAARRPLYLFLQVQDVSAQRQAEEELRLSEQRFRLLVETVQDYAIFMLDTEGRIASWNAGAQRIKGWTADEIVGQHFRRFYPPEVQAARHPEHELELAVRDGRYEEEGWRVRKDGTMFWAQVTITAVRDGDGELVGFAKVTRDNTERRRMEEEQSHFLAVTAHELRAPVGVLAGSASLLDQNWSELPDLERGELLRAMASSAGRLQRLLNDLLTASRIRSSALELDAEPFDLATSIERIVRSAHRFDDAGDIVVDVAAGLTALGDADRFAQMVENLLGNALRHGAPPVTISAEPSDDHVDVAVTDAGNGVPDNMRSRLFERFATSSDGGTGLGLYIVRALARAQGGDATYRGDDGAFVVTLPLAEPAPTPAVVR